MPSTSRIEIRNALASGAIDLNGGNVVAWQPRGQAAVIWMSPRPVFAEGRAVHGGVPIIFPWFGAGRTGTMSPSHGLVRTLPWQLQRQVDDAEGTSVELSLDALTVCDPSWQGRFRLTTRVHFGDTFRQELIVENTSTQLLNFEESSHAYLHVSDVEQVRSQGLDGCAYDNQVAGQPERGLQVGDLVFAAETDRIYHCGGPVTLHDFGLDRSLVVSTKETANLVVWNPWARKSETFADFETGSWRSMVCVEGSNVRDASICLEPGETHVMTFMLAVGNSAEG